MKLTSQMVTKKNGDPAATRIHFQMHVERLIVLKT